MNFIKYLAGVFLVSASFSIPSFAGVNSASVSITVIPKTVTLSCTAAEGTDGCSVSLPSGLRSGSSVSVSYYGETGDYYGSGRPILGTATWTSGTTSSGRGACRYTDCYCPVRVYSDQIDDYPGINEFCYMAGVETGSSQLSLYRTRYWLECVQLSGEGSGQDCYWEPSREITYTFTVTY